MNKRLAPKMPPEPVHLPYPFVTKKQHILDLISLPTAQYDDLSPKGSLDDGIRDLITWINEREGWVTTSSCAGRVSVFAEGRRKADSVETYDQHVASVDERSHAIEYQDAELREIEKPEKVEHEKLEDMGEEEQERMAVAQDEADGSMRKDGKDKKNAKSTEAGIGGKGGGGKCIFISHDPIALESFDMESSTLLGMKQMSTEDAASGGSFTKGRLIHFKFEPMILHVLTASNLHAQSIVSAALQAGFRESGAINIYSNISDHAMPMVAVRSTGLALDCIVGRLSVEGKATSLVPNGHLMGLLEVANERFTENSRRIQRFWDLLKAAEKKNESMGKVSRGDWEDTAMRNERKRVEGLRKSEEMRRSIAGKVEGE